jgi:hypothetical protein
MGTAQRHSGTMALEGDEQPRFPPLPGGRYPSSDHPRQIPRTVAYRPGSLGEVLTEHRRRAHPTALGFPSR